MSILALIINGHWVHDLSKFVPFLHYQEKFGVRYYGLAYVLGFLCGAWLMRTYANRKRSLVPATQVMDLLFYLMVGVFVGGRLGWFIFYNPGLMFSSPLTVLRVWEGGMSSHGGFVGVAIAIYLFARSRGIPFLHVSDVVISTAPIGLFFGRVANFINGELWGTKSNVPWAVIFPESEPSLPVELIPPRHPSQLYEAALEGLLLFVYLQLRFWKSDTVKRNPGQIAGEFLIGYAIVRSIAEQFREPDSGLILGMTRGTFYSLFLIVAGVIFIVRARRSASTRTAA